jgi:hypothetical protein
MAVYEVVHEIQNLCANNQLRDVSFDEIETDDPEGYVRDLLRDEAVSLTVVNAEPDNLTIHVQCGGVSQRFLFTRCDP